MKKLILIFIFLPIFATSGNFKHTGVVKFYNENKKFGYIFNKQNEWFVYDSGLIDEIQKNDIVIFNSRNTRKGVEAVNVKIKI